jgi:hypothetical protein
MVSNHEEENLQSVVPENPDRQTTTGHESTTPGHESTTPGHESTTPDNIRCPDETRPSAKSIGKRKQDEEMV